MLAVGIDGQAILISLLVRSRNHCSYGVATQFPAFDQAPDAPSDGSLHSPRPGSLPVRPPGSRAPSTDAAAKCDTLCCKGIRNRPTTPQVGQDVPAPAASPGGFPFLWRTCFPARLPQSS